MRDALRVGLVGCGNISTAYLRLAPLYRGFRIVSVADLNPDAAQSQADAFGVAARSVDALMNADDLDLILNLTIPAAHADVSARALEAGKHVYSEKPFVLNVQEGRVLAALAESKGLRIGSAPDTFLGAAHQHARHLVDQGVVGQLASGTAIVMGPGMESWHPNPDFFFQPGAGPVLDMGPYYVSNLVQLLGPVQTVSAMSMTARNTRRIDTGPRAGQEIAVETPTTLHAQLRFADGALVTFLASWDVWSHGHSNIELYGTEGTLTVPDPNQFGGPLALTKGAEPLDVPIWPHPLGVVNDGSHANFRGIGLADMAQAIVDGRPHRCAFDFSLHVVDVMTSILRAAETGLPVEIDTTCARPAPLDAQMAKALLRG